MKTSILILALAAGSAFAGTSGKGTLPPPAETGPKFSGGVDIDYASKYEFRGYDLGDNLIDADIYGAIDFQNGLTINLMAWYALLPDDDYQELDITPSVAYDFGPVTLAGVYTRYQYLEGGGENTNEFGLTLTTDPDLLHGLSFGLGSYYDVDIEGWYFELGGTYSYKINDMVAVDLKAGVSYVSDWGLDGDGFNHAFVGLGLPIKLAENVTLKPYVRGVFPIDKLDDTGADDLCIGGVTLGVTF